MDGPSNSIVRFLGKLWKTRYVLFDLWKSGNVDRASILIKSWSDHHLARNNPISKMDCTRWFTWTDREGKIGFIECAEQIPITKFFLAFFCKLIPVCQSLTGWRQTRKISKPPLLCSISQHFHSSVKLWWDCCGWFRIQYQYHITLMSHTWGLKFSISSVESFSALISLCFVIESTASCLH